MMNTENFVSPPTCFLCCSLTFSFCFFNGILLFTRLLGCPSAVVINMLPVTVLCSLWCEGADKPGCRVHGDRIQALSESPRDGS